MISEQSRYRNAEFRIVTTDAGNIMTVYTPPVLFPSTRYDVYLVREGDRLENLAEVFYQDPTKWYLIADANPQVFFPDDITPGTRIRIPR